MSDTVLKRAEGEEVRPETESAAGNVVILHRESDLPTFSQGSFMRAWQSFRKSDEDKRVAAGF